MSVCTDSTVMDELRTLSADIGLETVHLLCTNTSNCIVGCCSMIDVKFRGENFAALEDQSISVGIAIGINAE